MFTEKLGLKPRRKNKQWLFRLGQYAGSMVMCTGMALGLGSCATNSPSSSSSMMPTQPTLKVVTTFLPITQFTKAVAGNRAQVIQLLPTTISPHDYQAKPDDVLTLTQADVLVQNGLGMEEFLEDLVKNAGNSKLKVIDSSQGIQTITSASIEGKDHDHNHDHESKPQTNSKKDHVHGLYNPHIWLDPKRVVQQVQTIRDGLIASDPDGKTLYTANAAIYIEQLKELDAETTQLLLPYANKTFVAFHDFAPYFAQSYNLNATFLVDVPNENPSPEDVKRIVNTVKQTQLKAILTEPQAGERIFATLSKDLAIQVSVFDPLETAPVDGIPSNYYLTTMRQNVKTLLTALTGKSTVLQAPSNWYGFTQPWVIIPQRVAIRF